MEVIPLALIDRDAGIRILREGGRGGTQALYILYAVLTSSPAFNRAKGTMLDRYKAYISSREDVAMICDDRYGGADPSIVAAACNNVFTFNPDTGFLECEKSTVRVPVLSADYDMLFFGAVAYGNDEKEIVGVIDDSTRIQIVKMFSDLAEYLGMLNENPEEIGKLAKMGKERACRRLGPSVQYLFDQAGNISPEILADKMGQFRNIIDSLHLTGGRHPIVSDVIRKVQELETFGDEDFEKSVFAQVGAIQTKKAKLKEIHDFNVLRNTSQFFIFSNDIAAAKETLQSRGMPYSDADAIRMLADEHRTGDRHFPRFGIADPATCTVFGTKNLLIGDNLSRIEGKWENLYTDFARMSDSEALKIIGDSKMSDDTKMALREEILRDIVQNSGPGRKISIPEANSPFGDVNDFYPPYQVVFTDSGTVENAGIVKMTAVMRLLGNRAVGFGTRSAEVDAEGGVEGKDGNMLTDAIQSEMSSAMANGAIEHMGDEVRNVVNGPSENRIFSAAVKIFREFPELMNSPIFQANKDLFMKYKAGVHKLQSTGENQGMPLDEDDATALAAETLHAMISGSGKYGTQFFDPSKFSTNEWQGMTYITNWGLNERAEQLQEYYLEKVNEKQGALAGGKYSEAAVRNMFPYILLGRQYGAAEDKVLSGAIRDLVEFESDMHDLVMNSAGVADFNDDDVPLGEFRSKAVAFASDAPEEQAAAVSEAIKQLHMQINLDNLGALLVSPNDTVKSSGTYDQFMRTLFMSKYRNFADRIAIYKAGMKSSSSDVGTFNQLDDTSRDDRVDIFTFFRVDTLEGLASKLFPVVDLPVGYRRTFKVALLDPKQRPKAIAMLLSVLDKVIVGGMMEHLGILIASIAPDLLNGKGEMPLSNFLSDSEYSEQFDITIGGGNDMAVMPVAFAAEKFLGFLYGMGDHMFAEIGRVFEDGDYEKLAELIKHIYSVDKNERGRAILTIPGIKATSKPIKNSKFEATLAKKDDAGEVAGQLRSPHDDDWVGKLNTSDAESDDVLLTTFKESKKNRDIAKKRRSEEKTARSGKLDWSSATDALQQSNDAYGQDKAGTEEEPPRLDEDDDAFSEFDEDFGDSY